MGVAWDVSPDVERYDDALNWFGKRQVMTRKTALKLDDDKKVDAFWVGGGLQITQVQHVFDELQRSIEKGETLADFKARVKGTLSNPHHTETVFRNATQRAYNAGRYAQMREESTAKFRPFWLYDAVLDDRTTEICKLCNGTLLPLDHPWWQTHIPPLHHRCRASLRNLRRAEAEKRGISTLPGEKGDAPPGWGHAPGLAEQWKPDPKKHDEQLLLDFGAKATWGTKKRKPRTPRKPKEEPTLDLATWVPHYELEYGAEAAKSVGHGRAALELGLDMNVGEIRKQLKKLDAPVVSHILDALVDAEDSRTLREQGGELDPVRKLGAALAGHLRTLPKRPKVSIPKLERDPVARRAMSFYSQITGPSVKHPDASWTIVRHDYARAGMNVDLSFIQFNGARIGSLEHEWGHAVELLRPELKARSVAFAEARTKGEKAQKLSILLKNPSYADDEVAKPDRFWHHYVGKVYENPDGSIIATEVVSMGVDVLFAGRHGEHYIGELVQKDPEHFWFVLGQLAGP